MQGYLTDSLEPRIELTIAGASGTIVQIDAVIDTGFSDELTLPSEIVSALDLPRVDQIRIRLADGSTRLTEVHEAKVQWFGGWRTILVQTAESDSLIGVALLANHDLNISFTIGGVVSIEGM